MNIKNSSILKNQSGAALVIALIMMIVLTLIGLASIFTSTFEIKISGNKRGSTDAFYSADSGVQVVIARVENFNINAYNPTTHQYNPFTDLNNVNPTNAAVTITNDTTQEGAPRGYGFSAINFEFQHFLIASTGRDQTDLNPIRSTSTIQEKLVRLVPTLQGGY
jgi:Tfp pilus assembly protein PilX